MFLVGAIVCVYVCIQLYCSCCHYGVIKHDDDENMMMIKENNGLNVVGFPQR